MKRLLLGGALLALLVPAAPASAKKLNGCKVGHLAPHVEKVKKRGISCIDARVVVQTAERHRVDCRPDEETTIAPFKECTITPVLSVGNRNFFCRARWDDPYEGKHHYRTVCKSGFKDVVRYKRDGNMLPSRCTAGAAPAWRGSSRSTKPTPAWPGWP